MGAESPRITVWYQMLASRPSDTSPSTTALGAMNAVGWIKLGRSAGLRDELHPPPAFDWFLLRRRLRHRRRLHSGHADNQRRIPAATDGNGGPVVLVARRRDL